MKIETVMTRPVRACAPTDTLDTAAHLMWEGDCGIVPVVDADGRPVGVLTDRDVCMSALFNGARLAELPVARAMSRELACVSTSDSVHDALDRMRERRLRRLPVVDGEGRLVGMLSLADLAGLWSRRGDIDERELRADDVARTLAGVCHGAQPEPDAVMVVEIQPQARPAQAGPRPAAGASKAGRKPRAARSAKPRAKAAASRSKGKKT
jgi:CBS domain-containing protein